MGLNFDRNKNVEVEIESNELSKLILNHRYHNKNEKKINY
jgi:hypothetical protein